MQPFRGSRVLTGKGVAIPVPQGMTMSTQETEFPAPPTPSYAEEVLCANWNPLAAAVVELRSRAEQTLAECDIEGFLARLYLCQRA